MDVQTSPERQSLLARFSVFAECLLVGVWLVLAALPLITLLPSFAAASGHLRRYLDHEEAGRREFAADLGAAVRGGWRFSLLWWAALMVLAFDVWVATSGGLPGGPFLAVPVAAAAVVLVVVGLRTAAAWRPGDDWFRTARDAVRRTCRADRGGSLLLVGGLLVVAVAAWQLPPLVPPALGCLAACAVAVERRTGG